MVRVGVLGATGRMGREVCRSVLAAQDMELVAAVDPRGAGAHIGPGGDEERRERELVVADKIEALAEAGAEVGVDFTEAAAARGNLRWLADHGMHAVVGTTGLTPDDLEAIRRACAAGGVNAVLAPNFAIGAVLLMRFCELAAPLMDAVEVVELHHDAKRDAPSGTAVQTAQRMDEARRRAGLGGWPADPTTTHTLPGARGASGAGGVHVHSLRLPGLVAHQEVVFGAVGQTLTIRHDTVDRSSFMPGVLLAVRQVASRPGVTTGLDELLGL
jgi:4-hydroxy-tetrahydrodipicolinate reductase